MERPEDAEKAKKELNSTCIEGRKIEVNSATARIHSKKPKTNGGERKEGKGGMG